MKTEIKKTHSLKGVIKEKTISKMTDFLNLLSGKSLLSSEIQKLGKEHRIRSSVEIYSLQLHYCVKKGNYYCYLDTKFQPIQGKRLIELSNQYNEDSIKKKLLRLQGEENKKKLEDNNIQIFKEKNEKYIENLKINIESLIKDKKTLNEAIIRLKNTIDNQATDNVKLCNQIRKLETENSSLNESTFEVQLLREKIVRLENLLLAYFK